MPARLVPLTAGLAPPIPVQRPVVLIGRHPECDVRIDLPQISRRHCCLAQAYDRLTIRDLGSRNGVRLNGRRIEEARLVPGDEVAIGALLYRLEDSRALPGSPDSASQQSKPPSSISDISLDPNDPDNDLVPLSDMFPNL